MNKHHENKLTMYLGVESVLEENSDKTSTLPALAGCVAKFKTLIGTIHNKSKEFDSVATGKTQVKWDAEEALLDELLPAASSLMAYAQQKKDIELAAKAAVTESGLRKLRDTELVTKANGLLELLQANLSKLADFGVTDATLTSLRQKIDAYADALGKKESGYSDRTSVRKAMFDVFDEADALLGKQIDPLMEQFRKRETEFYNAYFEARWIKEMGAARKAKVAPPLAQPAN